MNIYHIATIFLFCMAIVNGLVTWQLLRAHIEVNNIISSMTNSLNYLAQICKKDSKK